MNKINRENPVIPELYPMVELRRPLIQTRGDQVLTENGIVVSLSTVSPGMRLMDEYSRPVTIKGIKRKCVPAYEIIPTKGHPFFISEDQPLYLTSRESEMPLQLPAKEIAKMSWFKRRNFGIPRARYLKFCSSKELPLDAYFFGLLLGDGCFRNSTVSLKISDRGISESIKDMAYEWNIHTYRQRNGSSNFYFKKGKLKSILQQLGLFGHKTNEKFIPPAFLYASLSDRQQLIAGLLDADGSLNGRTYDFTTSSWKLALDVAFLARSIGLGVRESEITKQGKTYARLYVYGKYQDLPLKHTSLDNRTNPQCELFKIRAAGLRDITFLDVPSYLMADLTIRKGDFL